VSVVEAARPLIRLALAEDLGERGDVTAQAVVPEAARARAELVARRPGVLAGIDVAREVFLAVDPSLAVTILVADGTPLHEGLVVARIEGSARALLAAERTALNFVQRLSGVASLTARYVEALRGTSTCVLDTRKTTPGWRVLEKYAVATGGGKNHRRGLYDMLLVKDNHELVAGGVGEAARRAVAGRPGGLSVEIEVRTLADIEAALAHEPEGLLFDNMTPDLVARGVGLVNSRAPRPWIEVSGGVTLDTIRRYALPGVDFISVGALTHSAPALDLALDFVPL
jgi:nicotinate-nucleotide pyrophosphorylase (carboxylating)